MSDIEKSNEVEIEPRFGYVVERVKPERPLPPRPLTEREVRQLLAIAVANDNRDDNDSVVLVWLDASRRGRWTFAEAEEAMLDHYTNSREYLVHRHITEAIRKKRNDAIERKEAEEARVVDQASADRVRAMCEKFGVDFFSIRDDSRPHPRGLHVQCPSCKAPRGEGCRHPTRGKIPGLTHPSRLDAEAEYIARGGVLNAAED